MKRILQLLLCLFLPTTLSLSCGTYCRCARGEYRGNKRGQVWIVEQQLFVGSYHNRAVFRATLQPDGNFWVGDSSCSWAYNSHQCNPPSWNYPMSRLVAWIDVDGNHEADCDDPLGDVYHPNCLPDPNDPQGIGPAPGRENDAPWVITISDPNSSR